MSGIALVLHLDGRPAQQDDLVPMLAEMVRRGPEGEGRACDGPVALGHRMLATTPEAMVEPMPFHHADSGCRITGHIRLDNRADLLTRFKHVLGLGRVIGDGELTVLAWLTWGEDCAQHLLGDFAFALWDPRRGQVFAARDQMGMRQLIYAHRPGRVFACASSTFAVSRAPGIGWQLNETRLAEALIDFEHGDLTSTFCRDVFRLPAGHCLTVGDNGLTLRRYWQLEPPPQLHLPSDDAYAKAFRDVLAEAVRCRMRGAGQVGAMLSGGMDSGSAVALACRISAGPLPTFSSVGPDPAQCIETRAIHTALTMPNLAPTLIDFGNLGPWQDDLIASWQRIEEPFDFHMTLVRATYLAAQRAGVTVVLDGVAGDVVLGEGNQMARQIRAGQWRRALHDAQGMAQFHGLGRGAVAAQLYEATRNALVPDALRHLRQMWRRHTAATLPKDAPLVASFARQSGLMDSLQAARLDDLPHRMGFVEERIRDWPRSGINVGRERYDRVAADFGIEPRDPFMDRRVQAFCLSLPMDQLQKDGWAKIILRRAMAGLLPDEVRWRRGKEHLGWDFTRAVANTWEGWQSAAETGRTGLIGKVKNPMLTNDNWSDATPAKLLEESEGILPAAVFLTNLRHFSLQAG